MQETRLFDVRLHAGRFEQALHTLLDWAAQGRSAMVCLANVDMLTRARRHAALAGVLDHASLVLSDGMPLVWALRRLKALPDAERVSGPSLCLALLARAEQLRLSVYFFGGSGTELPLLLAQLRQRFPALRVVGAESPPLLPEEPPEDADVLARIRASGARLVFVGLGCPKQEFWMRTHAPQLDAVCLGVGYAFPLLAGTQTRAPLWMQRSGLEWLFRLWQEPGRLWKRYLVGNTVFASLVLRALLLRRDSRG